MLWRKTHSDLLSRCVTESPARWQGVHSSLANSGRDGMMCPTSQTDFMYIIFRAQADRTAAHRNVVDDQSDFFEIDGNAWLSEEVRRPCRPGVYHSDTLEGAKLTGRACIAGGRRLQRACAGLLDPKAPQPSDTLFRAQRPARRLRQTTTDEGAATSHKTALCALFFFHTPSWSFSTPTGAGGIAGAAGGD